MFKKLIASRLGSASPRSVRRSNLDYGVLEPRQLLTTFYVDATAGSDANPGTEAAPLASYLPFVSAYGQEDPNVGRIGLQPGDEVVFAAGTYDETFRLPGSNIDHGFRLRNVHGTEADPIILRGEDGVVLNAQAANGAEVTKLELFDASHFVIEGFEVTGLGTGIQITNSQDILVQENWIHDIEGQASSIIAGLAVSASSDIEATANLIHDNYDRSTAAFNSYNVEFDENTGYVEFHNNYVFNTNDNIRTGTGPGVKHDGEGLLEIHSNVIRNAANAGIALDTRLVSVHHNLVLNSEAFWLIPNESISANEELHDVRVFNNTIVDQTQGDRVGGGLNFSARVQDADASINFNDNIVVDLDQQGLAQGILNIAPYGSDAEYEFWVESGRIQAEGNVYFNPNFEPVFDVSSAASRGELGGLLSFEQWQELGFDANGISENPQLDTVFLPNNPDAIGAGWYADDASRLTILPPADLGPLAQGEQVVLQVVRSGDDVDLSTRQVVTLRASDDSLLELPSSVTFAPGQSTVSFTVQATEAMRNDTIQATRIWAEAPGIEDSLSTWLRVDGGSATTPVEPVTPAEPTGPTAPIAIPAIVVQQTDGNTVVAESGENVNDSFAISLSTRPTSNVVINIGISDSQEVSVDKTRLVFTPSNWNQPQTVVVSGVADGVVDGDQSSRLEISISDSESALEWAATESLEVSVNTLDTDVAEAEPDGYRNGILTLPGDHDETVNLDFEFTTRLAQFDNELGLIVLDTDGTIDGVAPGDTRFAEIALRNSDAVRTVFASGETVGARQQLSFAGGSQIIFFLIQNASREQFLQANPTNRLSGNPVAFFSTVESNRDGFDHVRATHPSDGAIEIAWEDIVVGGDRSFTDAVINLSIAIETPSAPPLDPPPEPSNPIHNAALPGDVDGDGRLTIRDVFFAFDAVRNSRRIPGFMPDVNNDGEVDLQDVRSAWDKFFEARILRVGERE